ncbi:MAG TPA: hypothetical protein PLB81_02250 [Deltaproteobacteria bacterium]|nr:hypothetical protein [Deltaproteobacteria bacterium]
MESDTKKKVKDLFSLMDGISSEIDLQAQIETLNGEINTLKLAFHELSKRFETFEKTYEHKKNQVRQMKKEMETILHDLD